MKKFLLSTSLILSCLSFGQVASFYENFEDAVMDKEGVGVCGYRDFPYNDWTSDYAYPFATITPNCMTGANKYAKIYAGGSLDPIHIISPEVISTEGVLKASFNGSKYELNAILEIGIVENKNDLSTLSVIKTYEINKSQAIAIETPKSNGKYFVFKFTPKNEHQVFGLDNIRFTGNELSTNEFSKKTELKFAINLMTNKLIFSNENIKTVKVFNPNGNLVIDEKIANNELNIAKLPTGVYFILGENELGDTFSSKFIKK